MLDHLYDLLDEAEAQAFLGHLAGCPACQAALEKARAEQRLLASAARGRSPACVHRPADEPRPAWLPLAPSTRTRSCCPSGRAGPPRPRSRRWVGWAAAAAVLLAVGGLSVPAYRAHERYAAARRGRRRARPLGRRRPPARSTRPAQKVDDIHREINARELRLVVTGPRTVQPGARPSSRSARSTSTAGPPTPICPPSLGGSDIDGTDQRETRPRTARRRTTPRRRRPRPAALRPGRGRA